MTGDFDLGFYREDYEIPPDGHELCPEHGDSLGYHEDQGDEYETREHLRCTEPGCGYEVWA